MLAVEMCAVCCGFNILLAKFLSDKRAKGPTERPQKGCQGKPAKPSSEQVTDWTWTGLEMEINRDPYQGEGKRQ